MLGLGLSLTTGGVISSPAAILVAAFKSRVIADGGTVESPSCAKSDVKFLLDNPEPVDFTGLLNDYSGAAAAYSLRLLDNTYSGNAIKVRRSSDNAEQDIAFVNNELDTASLETFASGTDAFVTTWYDQSGNGYNMTQSTASSQPKIVAAGSTLTLNAKPAIQSTTTNQIISSWTLAANLFSFMAVFEFTGTNSRLFTTDGASSGLRNTSGNDLRARGTTDVTLISSTTTQGQLLSSGFGTSSFSGYVNGNLGGSGNIGSYQSGSLRFGANTNSFAGLAQEMIFYNTDESTNRTGIETNINDFYSIY